MKLRISRPAFFISFLVTAAAFAQPPLFTDALPKEEFAEGKALHHLYDHERPKECEAEQNCELFRRDPGYLWSVVGPVVIVGHDLCILTISKKPMALWKI